MIVVNISPVVFSQLRGGKKESRLDMLPLLYISHLCSALAVARLGSGFHKQSKVISPRSAVH